MVPPCVPLRASCRLGRFFHVEQINHAGGRAPVISPGIRLSVVAIVPGRAVVTAIPATQNQGEATSAIKPAANTVVALSRIVWAIDPLIHLRIAVIDDSRHIPVRMRRSQELPPWG